MNQADDRTANPSQTDSPRTQANAAPTNAAAEPANAAPTNVAAEPANAVPTNAATAPTNVAASPVDSAEIESFRTYSLMQNRTHVRTMLISSLISFAFLMFSYFVGFSENTGVRSDTSAVLLLVCCAAVVMLNTALCGKTAGALVVWLMFNVQTFLYRENFAYEQIIGLGAVLVVLIPTQRNWFKSALKTVLAPFVMTPVLVLVTLVTAVVLAEGEQIAWNEEIRTTLRTLTVWSFSLSATVSLLMFLFHHCVPERIKKLFPASSFSSHEIISIRNILSGESKGHVGNKIMSLIVAEAVLLMIVPLGVAGALMDNFSVLPTDTERAMFMTKLTLILALEALPLLFITVDFARVRIANPIMFMSRAIDDFYSKTLQKKDGAVFDVHKLGISNRDEIGVLFNSLKKTVDNVTAYVNAIEREKQLEADLIKANAANEAQRTFLSSMSHEIRTPINAVLGLDEMILRESSEPAIKNYARDIQSSGKSLLSIINDILDFSKIEAGKMEIINADYDLRAVITDLSNMIEQRALGKGLSFMIDVDETIPHLLHGDDTRIKQCALNILTNAVKYTPSGGVTMQVSGKLQNGDTLLLTFTISDTGIGIKEEDLPKLTKPFERIEEGRNRSIEGTGLGMSIVNGLLSGMGSRLEVQSIYGKGSTFSFTVAQTVRSPEPIGTKEEARAALAASTNTYTESFQAPGAHILVVDDTFMNLTVFKGLLKQTRLQIDTAEDAEKGLALTRAHTYDLLFIDHLMPKMDGIEMLKILRAESGNPNQNGICVALTANAVSGAREMYLQAGFEDYLSKPVDGKLLEALIMRHLPEKLVLHEGDSGFVAQTQVAGLQQSAESGELPASEVSELVKKVLGIDIATALKNCGGSDTFLEAARDFYDAIDVKSADIEHYCAIGDWQNYTVLVHALKSSARLIGAAELSATAAALEQYGNAAKQEPSAEAPAALSGNAAPFRQGTPSAPVAQSAVPGSASASIRERTPALLSAYRAYRTFLAPLFAHSAAAASVPAGTAAVGSTQPQTPAQEKTAEAQPLSPSELSQAELVDMLSALREVVSAFDFDTADSIIAELSTHALPADFAPTFAALKTAVRNADYAAVMQVLTTLT